MNSFFCSLPQLQLIVLEGDKAAAFLQGQVTCDVREITATQTRRGAHCSPKGRVLSTFRVLQFQERLYLLVPASMTELVISQLNKYAGFSKINLRLDDALKVMGCVGSDIAETLQSLFKELAGEPDVAVFYNGELLLIRVQDANTVPRFEIVGTTASLQALQKKLQEKYSEQDYEYWRLSEINAAIPSIYPQTLDLFTPQMLNYPEIQGVSFKKGCYIGQEVIARTHYLGKAKRHLHRLYLNSKQLPAPGDPLQDAKQQIVGTVVDAVFQKETGCSLLAVLQDEAKSTEIFWQSCATPLSLI